MPLLQTATREEAWTARGCARASAAALRADRAYGMVEFSAWQACAGPPIAVHGGAIEGGPPNGSETLSGVPSDSLRGPGCFLGGFYSPVMVGRIQPTALSLSRRARREGQTLLARSNLRASPAQPDPVHLRIDPRSMHHATAHDEPKARSLPALQILHSPPLLPPPSSAQPSPPPAIRLHFSSFFLQLNPPALCPTICTLHHRIIRPSTTTAPHCMRS